MILKYKYLYYIYYLLVFRFKVIFTKEFIVSNNSNDINNIWTIIKNNQVENKELIFRFNEDYYDMSLNKEYTNELNVISNVSFIGNINGTIFDYNRLRKGTIYFILNEFKRVAIKIENIIFQNFYIGDYYAAGVFLIASYSNHNNFNIIFNNCTFRNNDQLLLSLTMFCDYRTTENPTYIFNNCNFYNNTRKLMEIKGIYNDIINEDEYCLIMKMVNCYFSNMNYDKYEETDALLYTSSNRSKLTIKDSIIENINSKDSVPIINTKYLIFRLVNTTISNCYTNYNYLFNLDTSHFEHSITIKGSTFKNTSAIFSGSNSKYDISDSLFHNVTLKKSIPAIFNSKASYFYINDTEFKNLNLISGIWEGESTYYLYNVNFIDIKTNSKALLHIVGKDVYFTNVTAENISCVGDGSNTSMILFDSNNIDDFKKIHIFGLNVINSFSNGPLIKTIGNYVEMIIDDSNINKIKTYGPIIETKTNKLNFHMSNLNFNNNINDNKLECGTIHFINDLSVLITNSTFNNNISKGDGGVLCLENISKLNLSLTNTYFIKNKAVNGGAIYISDSISKDIDNINDNIYNNIKIENNTFKENTANDFGGAIYSEYSKFYLADSKNNLITFNKAGIMGGGIYSPKYVDKTIFDLSNNIIENNTINSFIDNYTSKPSYILLNTIFEDDTINIITGEYISLVFTLYDEFDNIVNDITKFYSSITLKLTLTNEYEYDQNNLNYIINGNICSFINGKCELNNLRIYSNPELYIMDINIENYTDEIKLKINKIKINILPCISNQIKMYKNDILYCENPICKSNCPNNTATCIAYYSELYNDIEKNICECMPGWKNENCNEKVYIDLSFFFISYSNPLTCMLKFLFKNFGMSTILMIQVMNTLLGYFLGISFQSSEIKSNTAYPVESIKVINKKDHLNKFDKNMTIDNRSSLYNSNENSLFTKESKIDGNNFEELYTHYINKKKESSINMEYLNTVYGKQGKHDLIKKIKFIYYSILEIVINYIIFKKQKRENIWLEVIFNSWGYLMIFILFSMDNIYYIIKKKGDDYYSFFVYPNKKLCILHHSYTCGCVLEKKSNEDTSDENIEEFISFYLFCSDILINYNGRIKFITMKNKLKFLSC
ncbi:hypothetical protein H8356DRAFT_950126 [Neocallimastix lanati (nom. inval.)]|nr:hypothetical protein H8356DRAFT_950126 [Neocallimastix sp. JGI-2020a]